MKIIVKTTKPKRQGKNSVKLGEVALRDIFSKYPRTDILVMYSYVTKTGDMWAKAFLESESGELKDITYHLALAKSKEYSNELGMNLECATSVKAEVEKMLYTFNISNVRSIA